MPDPFGKYNLLDFRTDLQQRGFDRFTPEVLDAMINRAYFAVAAKSRWEWERTTVAFTLTPGQYYVSTTPHDPYTPAIPNFRSVERIYITTAGYQKKLQLMKEDDFFQNYLGLDLTNPDYRNEPSHYFLYDERIYVLSPPSMARSFVAYVFQRPDQLMTEFDYPITPQHLDEAIINAARVRAHTHSNEPGLSTFARADLEEIFDDMRDDEEEDMHEYQERVSPDNTWL